MIAFSIQALGLVPSMAHMMRSFRATLGVMTSVIFSVRRSFSCSIAVLVLRFAAGGFPGRCSPVALYHPSENVDPGMSLCAALHRSLQSSSLSPSLRGFSVIQILIVSCAVMSVLCPRVLIGFSVSIIVRHKYV